MRILVAEDDTVIAEFVAQGLREAGFVVEVAPTGPDGLRKAASRAGPVSGEDTALND